MCDLCVSEMGFCADCGRPVCKDSTKGDAPSPAYVSDSGDGLLCDRCIRDYDESNDGDEGEHGEGIASMLVFGDWRPEPESFPFPSEPYLYGQRCEESDTEMLLRFM